MPNCIQHLAITGDPTSGDFTLRLDGQQTTSFQTHPTAQQVETLIGNLSNVGSDNVFVVATTLWEFDIEFIEDLTNTPVSKLEVATNNLAPPNETDIEITMLADGAPDAPDPPDPPVDDSAKDAAILAAYEALVKIHHGEAGEWPARRDELKIAIALLEPFYIEIEAGE